MKVTLNRSEIMRAIAVGVDRNLDNIFNDRHHRHGFDGGNGWDPHIEGAAAELALANILGIPWDGNLGNLDADDVGHFQVRQTRYSSGKLRAHPDDKDHRAYVLMTGLIPTFSFGGWLLGRDCKKREYWCAPQSGRYAYFVPQSKLNKSLASLPVVDLDARGVAQAKSSPSMRCRR
jgi:hypothetical protein